MARVAINTGATANDGTGDNLRAAGGIINNNFTELYTYLGAGSSTVLTAPMWNTTTSGINTLRSVGIGTTNPRFALEVGSVGTSGTSLWVNGNARITGILTVGSSSITVDGSSNIIRVGSGITINGNSGIISATAINLGGTTLTGAAVTYITAGSGISVNQNTGNVTITATGGGGGGGSGDYASVAGIATYAVTSGISTYSSISGVSTYSSTSGISTYSSLSGISTYSQISGISTYSSLSGIATYALTSGIATYATTAGVSTSVIGGIASITQLSVSGISTLSSNVSVGGTISVNGGVTLATNNATIVGTSATAGEIKRIGGAPFFYDGSAWREFVLSSGTPVTQSADTEWDNVVFRATFDDNFTDAKFGASPVYVGAGSTIVGAAATIGTGAYRNNGGFVTGVGVSYAYRSDYDFTGSWTIEFWIYHDEPPSTFETLVSQFTTADSNSEWAFGMFNTGSNIQWYWANENNPSTRLIYQVSNTTFNNEYLDKWSHYALVREGDDGSLHFYINGVESSFTYSNSIIDNDILHVNGAGLYFGSPGSSIPVINANTWNNGYSIDAIFDDVRISAGVGTAGQRYTSVGIYTSPTFTPPTTALPTTGTLSSYVQPPGDKYGEIGLGTSPTWRGTSGVTVSQQSSGNYRVSFASSYTNSNDYYVLSQGMDQGFASYVGIARSITHVDLSINRQSNNAAVDTGSLAVQIKNHI